MIQKLNPTIVWNNFYALTQCPRPSKHEECVREYILKWAKEKNIDAFADETGNIIMRVPASEGYENRKGVILQGHIDMVPQKTADKVHDFLKDPIETRIEGEWVKANNTTLGADNGMGVAMAMAVAEDKTLKHGPIEVLLTYDEETGMTGATKLKPGILNGDILINLDSEDEFELCIGCAGGLDVSADFKFEPVPVEGGFSAYEIDIKGLSGGHSGMDISLYRANANKVIANALLPVMEKHGVELAFMNGGSLRNAIPFEANAVILIPSKKCGCVVTAIKKNFAAVTARYAESDPNMCCTIDKAKDMPKNFVESTVAINALKAISACPSIPLRMSQSMEGLIETSINLAIVRTEKEHLKVHSLMRSAIDQSKEELSQMVRYIFEFAGASVKFSGGYSGWTPKIDTPINKLINDTHIRLFGTSMNISATHGGLECALLGAKYPNWEMVSIGPTIMYPHSPDEKVNIAAVGNSWELLKAVLEQIPVK